VVFTAHSVPSTADATSGPKAVGGHLYSRQVAESARLVAEAAGVGEYDVVWQSRSGPPSVPWLEPDVVDHVHDLAAREGVHDVVVCPIGFISDHVEVVWDLDTELVDETEDLGVRITRCATPGPSSEFTEMVLQLFDELETGNPVVRLGEVPSLGCTRDGARCAEHCCPAPSRRSR
jgi:ferrochelatase